MLGRRELFKSLAAATAAIGIKEVEAAVVKVEPHDTIVLRLPPGQHLTCQETIQLRDAAQNVFPTNKVIVLTDGIDLQIVRGA